MVSRGGGDSPHWRGDGKEMFYLASDGTIMSVDVTTNPSFSTGTPKPLFKGPAMIYWDVTWDVTSDGRKFLIPVPQGTDSHAYKLVLNWTSTLKR
jgi:hypothetical protein